MNLTALDRSDHRPISLFSGLLNNHFLAITILVGLPFVVSAWMSPYFFGYSTNTEVFRYMGMVIRNGGTLYVDAFDNKPPLIYFVAALMHGFGAWGMWLFAAFIVAGTGIAFYEVLRHQKWPFPLLGPTLFILAIYYDFIVETGIGHTRQIIACWILMMFCWNLVRMPWRWFCNGAIVCLTFFMQQNEILSMSPTLLALLALEKNRRKAIAEGCLGVLVSGAPIALYLLYKHAWQAFVYDAFIFNTKYIVQTQTTYWHNLAEAWSHTAYLGYRNIFLAVTGILIIFYKRWVYKRPLNVLIVGSFAGYILQLLCVAIRPDGRPGYYFPFIAYFVFLTYFAIVLGVDAIPSGSGRWIALIVSVLVLILLPHDSRHHPFKPRVSQFFGKLDPSFTPYRFEFPYPEIRKDLESVRGQRGQLYVMRDVHWVALETDYDIIAPTIWFYTFFWNSVLPHWDENGAEFQSILDGIQHFKTKYIIDCAPEFGFQNPSRMKEWNAFLTLHYDIVYADKDGWRFLRRKPLE